MENIIVICAMLNLSTRNWTKTSKLILRNSVFRGSSWIGKRLTECIAAEGAKLITSLVQILTQRFSDSESRNSLTSTIKVSNSWCCRCCCPERDMPAMLHLLQIRKNCLRKVLPWCRMNFAGSCVKLPLCACLCVIVSNLTLDTDC